MGRPKKEDSKDKRYWVRCTPEQYEKIQNMAGEKNVSMGEFTLAKIFNIEIEQTDGEKKCTYYIDNKQGEPRPYTLKYKTKKRGILKPVRAEY